MMSENRNGLEDADRVSSDAPAEGAESPGTDETATTPHPQDPAEGRDPEEPTQR